MSIRRDYKPASTWQRRRQVVRRHGLLVVTLVLIGLFGGLLAYIKGDRQQIPATAAVPASVPSAPAPSVAPVPEVAPEARPVPVKPKYDFYTELPKRQIEIQRESKQPQGARPNPPAGRPSATEAPRRPAMPDRNVTTPVAAATVKTE